MIFEEDILEGENEIAAAIVIAGRAIAEQLKYLGNGNAATHHGAIEAYGMHIGEKLDRLAGAIESLKKYDD